VKRIDMTGQRFGRLTVLSYVGCSSVGARWKCQCDCGNIIETNRNNLIQKERTRSCGCLRRESSSERHKTHGMTGSPTYRTWCSMRKRCEDKTDDHYKWYGARGITVCERWSSFENFLSDMGVRPRGMSLDRIDNDGPYSPENCRWATQKEQMQNTRKSVTFEGKTIQEWSEQLGIKYHTLTYRMRKHGSVFLSKEPT